MDTFKLIAIVTFAIVAPPVISYNRFIRQRTAIRNAWASIDTELRRRWDLIPNLVETVKAYAAHERGLLETVARARADASHETGGPAAHARAEDTLERSVDRLLAVAEGYPQLRADEHFLALQHELATTEDRIQTARRYYNATVRTLNTRVNTFPSLVLARMFGFTEAEFFEVEQRLRDPRSFVSG